MKIASVQFSVDFIVMKGVDYDILLGRPWMRNARVIEDWGNGLIFLGNRTEAVRVEMDTWKTTPVDLDAISAMLKGDA